MHTTRTSRLRPEPVGNAGQATESPSGTVADPKGSAATGDGTNGPDVSAKAIRVKRRILGPELGRVLRRFLRSRRVWG